MLKKIFKEYTNGELSQDEYRRLFENALLDLKYRKFILLLLSSEKYEYLQPSSDKSKLIQQLKFKQKILNDGLKKIIKILADNNVKIILLKSTALNNFIYSSAQPRIASDIDILISESDINKARKLLSVDCHAVEDKKKGVYEGFYEQTWCLEKPIPVYIDLHTSIVNPDFFKLDNNLIISESCMHPAYCNANVRTLTPTMQVIHLILHAMMDGYRSHHSFFDSAVLINKKDIGFEEIINMADFLGYKKIITQGVIFIANDLMCKKFELSYREKFLHKLNKIIMYRQFRKASVRRRIQQVLILIINVKISIVIKSLIKFLDYRIKYINR